MTISSTKQSPRSNDSSADDRAITSAGRAQLLSARGVAKAYTTGIWPHRRRVPVLRGADLELHEGEIVGLVGENGSGKSTLMKILVGNLASDAGDILRDGSLGYCPQDPILYERLTCDEHFELFGEAYGMSPTAIVDARNEVYEVLGFGRWSSARVEALSGGTRAKLNLGLALLPDPDILLLDEPRRFRLGHLPTVLDHHRRAPGPGPVAADRLPLHHRCGPLRSRL